MNWIRIAVGIKNDPRIAMIASDCKTRISESVGCVVSVLCEFPEHARTGNVASVPDALLEKWAGWEGKRGVFAKAFRQHLCEEDVCRSWEKHNGAAMRESDAARVRMQAARDQRRAAKESESSTEHTPNAPPKKAERSANVPRTRGVTFASDGTGRDVTTTPTKPDGLEGPPPANPTDQSGLFAQWEADLRAVALPHEWAAVEHIASRSFRPAVIGELHSIGSGLHVVRGKHNPRAATIADVMRAVSEFAIKAREWNQGYFRGVVRAIVDRPPEPPDAEQREQARLARELTQTVPDIASTVRHADLSEEERVAAAARRQAAMEHFRREFQRNNPNPSREEPTGVTA